MAIGVGQVKVRTFTLEFGIERWPSLAVGIYFDLEYSEISSMRALGRAGGRDYACKASHEDS